MARTKKQKVRFLKNFSLNGVAYKANDIAEFLPQNAETLQLRKVVTLEIETKTTTKTTKKGE